MSATFIEPAASIALAGEALTDEQILGIEAGDAANSSGEEQRGTPEHDTGTDRAKDDSGEQPGVSGGRDRNSQPRSPGARMPEWLVKVSEAVPEAGASDSRARLAEMWQRSAELDRFDAAYFGEDGAARRAFVERLHSENPAALKAMYEAAGAVMTRSANTPDQPRETRSATQAPATSHPAAESFDGARYADFERATNESVVAELNREIGRVMERALPEGIADGARRRIAEDTLAEVHGVLRGDRQLATQVAEAMRDANFSGAARQQVARLIATRARGVLPAAAKRVIGEWTGSVLATHRESAARQRSSEARVDILGGGVPQGAPRKGTSPREIDYRRTSDEEILSW